MILRGIIMSKVWNKICMLFCNMLQNRCFRIICWLAILLISFEVWAEPDEDYSEYCSSQKFTEKYNNADCWSCQVVLSLMQGMTGAATVLSSAIIEISKLVLLYGGAIWIACYFMKALGSFAAQDPYKILDGLIVFMFKWTLAYVMVYYGLDTIVQMVVDPLLDIGYTVGQSLNAQAGIGG